mgnify:CR=1 FL=1
MLFKNPIIPAELESIAEPIAFIMCCKYAAYK